MTRPVVRRSRRPRCEPTLLRLLVVTSKWRRDAPVSHQRVLRGSSRRAGPPAPSLRRGPRSVRACAAARVRSSRAVTGGSGDTALTRVRSVLVRPSLAHARSRPGARSQWALDPNDAVVVRSAKQATVRRVQVRPVGGALRRSARGHGDCFSALAIENLLFDKP